MPIAAPQPGKPLPSVGRRVEPHADSAGNVAGQTFNARFVICFFHGVSFELSRCVTAEDEVPIFNSLVAGKTLLHRRLVRRFAVFIK
jgi:hypothetical protein